MVGPLRALQHQSERLQQRILIQSRQSAGMLDAAKSDEQFATAKSPKRTLERYSQSKLCVMRVPLFPKSGHNDADDLAKRTEAKGLSIMPRGIQYPTTRSPRSLPSDLADLETSIERRNGPYSSSICALATLLRKTPCPSPNSSAS